MTWHSVLIFQTCPASQGSGSAHEMHVDTSLQDLCSSFFSRLRCWTEPLGLQRPEGGPELAMWNEDSKQDPSGFLPCPVCPVELQERSGGIALLKCHPCPMSSGHQNLPKVSCTKLSSNLIRWGRSPVRSLRRACMRRTSYAPAPANKGAYPGQCSKAV